MEATADSQDCKENPASCGKFYFDWALTFGFVDLLVIVIGGVGFGIHYSQNINGYGKEGHSKFTNENGETVTKRKNKFELSIQNTNGKKKNKDKPIRGLNGGIDRV